MTLNNTPIFILAGGLGTRMGSDTHAQPKPMVTIGDKPVLWHIMRKYRMHGFHRFVVCAGYKAHVIKDYFLNYAALNSDFTVDLSSGSWEVHRQHHTEDWKVTVAYTGDDTQGGGRISRATSRHLLLEDEHFGVTYGDGLTDADLGAEYKFHLRKNKIGTVLGVNFPSRFGEFVFDTPEDDITTDFTEKPNLDNNWINGGFFFFKREFLDLLNPEPDTILEREPLRAIATSGQLSVYKHKGFWQCMDTQRERDILEKMWKDGVAPWSNR